MGRDTAYEKGLEARKTPMANYNQIEVPFPGPDDSLVSGVAIPDFQRGGNAEFPQDVPWPLENRPVLRAIRRKHVPDLTAGGRQGGVYVKHRHLTKPQADGDLSGRPHRCQSGSRLINSYQDPFHDNSPFHARSASVLTSAILGIPVE